MVEQAGGASSCDGLCKSALDVPILNYDQRTEICFGSTGEVKRFEEYLYGEWHDVLDWVTGLTGVFDWAKLFTSVQLVDVPDSYSKACVQFAVMKLDFESMVSGASC